MKILITGGAGFIGSNLIKTLLKEGHTIVTVDNFNNYYEPLLKRRNLEEVKDKNFTLLEGDITDRNCFTRLSESDNFEKIIHLAACVGVRYSLENPTLYMKTNIEGTLNVLNFAKDMGIKDVIIASSSSVYGDQTTFPFKEDSVCVNPISPYAMSKRASELLCYTYHKLYGLQITIHRFFTVYGPNGRPDMAPYIFTKSLFENKAIPLYGDGTATRDFTFVDDIVKGINLSLYNPFPFEIFNLGCSTPINMKEFIYTLEAVSGKKANILTQNTIAGDVLHTYADSTKAKKLLNFQAEISLKDGLSRFVEWYRKYRL